MSTIEGLGNNEQPENYQNVNYGGINSTQGLPNTSIEGNIMGVGGGVEDDAKDINYSTKNEQRIPIGQIVPGQTTTTTTKVTHYGINPTSNENPNNGEILMGVGGSGNTAADVNYSSFSRTIQGPAPGIDLNHGKITTTTTSTTYGYGNGDNANGLLMGVGGEGNNALDVGYSTKTDNAGVLDLGNLQGTTTTTTTTTKYGIEGDKIDGLLMGVGG